jgi:predicted Na+-dependent transporter
LRAFTLVVFVRGADVSAAIAGFSISSLVGIFFISHVYGSTGAAEYLAEIGE